MTKNVLQDIKKKGDISPSSLEVKSKNSGILYGAKRKVSFPKIYQTQQKTDNEKNHYLIWVIAVLAVITLFFSISSLFSRAEIFINPKIKNFSINQNFYGIKNQDLSVQNDKKENNLLHYDLISISGEESETVFTGEEKDYLEKAEGVVLIYNSFSTNSEVLLAGTKLEGSNGKIYKTKNKIIIPGTGKKGTPGKESVEISALEPGEEYNSLPLDFKILSFKGTSKYNKIYGRSVGEITGGLKGKSRQVSNEEKEKIYDNLEKKLLEKLFEKAKDQTPSDYLLIKGGGTLAVGEENLGKVESDGKVVMSVGGEFTGMIFSREEIKKEILSLISNSVDGENKIDELNIYGIRNLEISLKDKNSLSLESSQNVGFNLYGDIKILQRVDEGKIIEEILGKRKKDFNLIMSKYDNVESASVKIKPFWKNSFPGKIQKINLKINYPDSPEI